MTDGGPRHSCHSPRRSTAPDWDATPRLGRLNSSSPRPLNQLGAAIEGMVNKSRPVCKRSYLGDLFMEAAATVSET